MKNNYPKYYHAGKKTFNRASKLRRNQTSSENRLWKMLRNKQVLNAKFRRQHPVGPFIVDFYCHQYLLVIELDGPVHNLEDVKENDRNRQEYIESLGVDVLRFTNEDVFEIPEKVIERIRAYLIQCGCEK